MSIDWSKAPEGATHCAVEQGGVIWFKDDSSFWKVWGDEGWGVIGLPASKLIPRPKQLTQAVFDGLTPEYRWAAIDRHGEICTFKGMPRLDMGFKCWSVVGENPSYWGKHHGEIDWQNSLIERLSDTCIDDMGIDTGIPVSVGGQKHDAQKPRHSLLPVGSVASVIDVLEFGAVKYGADNWQSVPDSRTRYYDAAMRHLGAWWGGERLDAESGLPHLAHAACCILFLMWGDK